MKQFVSLFVCVAILALLLACSPASGLDASELDLRQWFAEGAKPEPIWDTLKTLDTLKHGIPPDRVWHYLPEFDIDDGRQYLWGLPWERRSSFHVEYKEYIYAVVGYRGPEEGRSLVRFNTKKQRWEHLRDWGEPEIMNQMISLYAHQDRLFLIGINDGDLVVNEYSLPGGKFVKQTRRDMDLPLSYTPGALEGYGARIFIEFQVSAPAGDYLTAGSRTYRLYEYNADKRTLTVLFESDTHPWEFNSREYFISPQGMTVQGPYLLYDETVSVGDKEFQHTHVRHLDTGKTATFTSDDLPLNRFLFPGGLCPFAFNYVHRDSITFPASSQLDLGLTLDDDGNPYTDILTKDLLTKTQTHRVTVPGIVSQTARGDGCLAWIAGESAYLYDGRTVWLLYEMETGDHGMKLWNVGEYLYCYVSRTRHEDGYVEAYIHLKDKTVFYYDRRQT